MLLRLWQAGSLRRRQLLGEFSRITAAKESLRRQQHQKAHDAGMEARRQALLNKEASTEHKLQQRREVSTCLLTMHRHDWGLC